MSLEFSRRKVFQLIMGAMLAPTVVRPSMADEDGDNEGSDEDNDRDDSGSQDSGGSISVEQNTIKDAANAGQVATFDNLIQHLNKNYPGEILSLRLKKSSKHYFYSIKMLTNQGQIIKLKLDAKTFALLKN